MYTAIYSDPDLGNFQDDWIGSDTTLGVGYAWNSDNDDEGSKRTLRHNSYSTLTAPTNPQSNALAGAWIKVVMNNMVFDPGDREVIELNDHLEVYEVRAKEEVRIYCRSSQRGKKERAMIVRRRERFETQLQQLDEGLSRPRTRKRLDLVRARIDRMKRDSDGIGQHYEIDVIADEEEKTPWKSSGRPSPKTIPCGRIRERTYCDPM